MNPNYSRVLGLVCHPSCTVVWSTPTSYIPLEPGERAVETMKGKLLKDTKITLEDTNMVEDIRLIRSAALDEWAGLPKRAHQRLPERNMVAHGGRVILDVDTIRAYEAHQPERTTAWKKAFKQKYGLPYNWVLERPLSLLRWTDAPRRITCATGRRKLISVLRCANEINVAWWEEGESALEDLEIIAHLKELDKCWRSGRSG